MLGVRGTLREDGELVVRSATPADAARIAELLTELGYPAGVDDVAERLGYWARGDASQVLVAEVAGSVVGSISLHAIPYLERTGHWLRIESLVVDSGRRRGGLGGALMAAAERQARAWGCLQIEVTSLRSRVAAQSFYRRLGFDDACDQSGRFVREL
ncbi:MAG: GNAT family N-acetyltransferase [Nocardiopsaceae bacterium]|jgi:GNAT superfamily N-acetyltransferase|nr:GNAT family N-acetyltransferase [Nocardiopsaceae bacterium]